MRILSFLLKYSKGAVGFAVLAGLVSGAANTGLLAVINSRLTSRHASGTKLIWAFVGLCVLVPVTRVASELLLTYLGERTVYDLRMQMCRKFLTVPLRHLELLGAPRLMSILTGDIPSITAIVTVLPVLSINLAILVGCLIYLGLLSLKILGVVLVLIALGIVTYQIPVARAMAYYRQARVQRDALFAHFRAVTEGTKELKLHRRRRHVFLDVVLEGTAATQRRLTMAGERIYTIASSWGQLLVFVVIGLVLFALPRLEPSGQDLRTMAGYTLVLLYLMTPLQMMLNALPNISRAEVALKRVEELGLDLQAHASAGETGELAGERVERWKSVELSGVTHTYHREGENRDFVLGPIDLRLAPGEVVFLAGGNGSGKTTLAKLLVGLYIPEQGEVRLDGEPIGDAGREHYRQLFSVVFSDFFLFESLLGLESPELDERGRRHLAELQLEHKVEIKDGRLSTTDLSQGQRKRLALLTAYLEDRPIYVFDEWAADQDPYFKDIFYLQLLPELKRRGKTVLVISHDDRYYHLGDRLIKLDYGMIVDSVPAEAEPAAQLA